MNSKIRALQFVTILVFLFISKPDNMLGQNYPSGIYTDVETSSNKMIFYTTNGINYIISREYSYEADSGKIKTSAYTFGAHCKKKILNYISGPFAIYGEEGHFFNKNGKEYFYHELEASYTSNTETDPLDSMRFLYIKKCDLPTGWELKPEVRIGELGVLNKNYLYEIIKVEDIYRRQIKGNTYIYIKGWKGDDDHFGEYIISETDFLKLNISRIEKNEISDLKGKILQLFFKWHKWRLPGFLNLEGKESEEYEEFIPYEIKILNENLNEKSKFNFPKPGR